MNSRNRKPTKITIPATDEEYDRLNKQRAEDALAQIGATINVLAPQINLLLDQLAQQIYQAMIIKGFWEGAQDNFGSKVALVHSKLSEMLEANRKSITEDDKIPDFTGEEAEAADTMIRLLDMSGRYNWRLGEALSAKMLFNLSRPHKHGKAY